MSKISIACDHAGFLLKQEIIDVLKALNIEVIDHGCHSEEKVDYPDFAKRVAKDVSEGRIERGLLVCGTGIGMAITANKFKGVRAASITDVYSALMARKHNNLNVLCLGSRVIGAGLATVIVETFLKTEFEEGRHAMRVNKME